MPHRTPRRRAVRTGMGALAALSLVAACSSGGSSSNAAPTTTHTGETGTAETLLRPASGVTATLDPRYQSYNIEMVTVTGGEFWKPYDTGPGKQARPPIDLTSTRLRNLAKALGPVYIRVSGSWANSTYFAPNGTPADKPPTGFGGVLTGDQWKGVGSFAEAVDAKVITSFASSPGARDAAGHWKPDQAEALIDFSKANHVPLYGFELFNEPTLPIGFPPGYDAAQYDADHEAFQALVARIAPDMKVIGPSSTGENSSLIIKASISTEDMLKGLSKPVDIFSYHVYPKVSERCGSTEKPSIALTKKFLERVDGDRDFYTKIRDQYAPRAPMWVTETAEAACGGDRWSSTFRDVMRYVDAHGRLATGNGDVVFHNTLMGSDYGLLSEDGFVPRPDYWAAVLWSRLMGPKVLSLAPPTESSNDLTVYAHCTPKGSVPGVAYAVTNLSSDKAHTFATRSGRATVYSLTAPNLDATKVSLNGTPLNARSDGTLPALPGRKVNGTVTVPASSVAYIVEPVTSGPCA